MNTEFLHEHPNLQTDREHVVVDRADWVKARLFFHPSLPQVYIVSIPYNKDAIYIDEELVSESQIISATTLLEKLIKRGIVQGGKRYAKKTALNEVDQFPRKLPTDLANDYP